MAAPEPPPPPEGSKPLSALLSGIAQAAYYGNAAVTDELLRGQLYPEAPPEEFRALRAKMGGLLQVPAGGCLRVSGVPLRGGASRAKRAVVSSEQTCARQAGGELGALPPLREGCVERRPDGAGSPRVRSAGVGAAARALNPRLPGRACGLGRRRLVPSREENN